MYGNISDVKEGSGNVVLNPGIHKVHIESLEVSQISTANYTGSVADIILSDGTSTVKERIFPFSFNESFKNRDGIPITEAEQWDSYKARHLHLFSKACPKDQLEAAVNGAASFEAYINAYASKVTKANGGNEFKVLIIDKNGYSKYPMWTGGCACLASEDTLKFDPVKHGPKAKDDAAVEQQSSNTATDKLPF